MKKHQRIDPKIVGNTKVRLSHKGIHHSQLSTPTKNKRYADAD